jgi:anti-anti-sigma regulatory factor
MKRVQAEVALDRTLDRTLDRDLDRETVSIRLAAAEPVVLQPANLSGIEAEAFARSLVQALESAAVILIDLIWIESVDGAGLNVLLESMVRAEEVGTSLSFLSMDPSVRKQLDDRWEQRQAPSNAARRDVFAPDFEQFLANYQVRKKATLLAVEIASNRQW